MRKIDTAIQIIMIVLGLSIAVSIVASHACEEVAQSICH